MKSIFLESVVTAIGTVVVVLISCYFILGSSIFNKMLVMLGQFSR